MRVYFADDVALVCPVRLLWGLLYLVGQMIGGWIEIERSSLQLLNTSAYIMWFLCLKPPKWYSWDAFFSLCENLSVLTLLVLLTEVLPRDVS